MPTRIRGLAGALASAAVLLCGISSGDTAGAALLSPGFSGQATATANLATGTLGAFAIGQGQLFGSEGGQGVATGYLQELLTIHSAGPVTPVTVTFTVHGTMLANAPAGMGSTTVVDGLRNGAIDIGLSNDLASAFTTTLSNFSKGRRALSTLSDGNLGDVIFKGTYDAMGPDPVVGISMFPETVRSFNATCDFADTNSVGISLPPGVTFSSQSGVFLRGVAAPEPAGLALLVAPLGVLCLLRRRQRHSI